MMDMEIRPPADQILEKRASDYLDMIEGIARERGLGTSVETYHVIALALVAAAVMDVSYEINEK
jgi:hypothetical protein